LRIPWPIGETELSTSHDPELTSIEGVTILKFDTVDPARDSYRSPAYLKASRHRHLGADYAAVIVEGAKRPAEATSIPE